MKTETLAQKKEEKKKDERLLVWVDSKTIALQEKVINDKLPALNSIYRVFMSMDLGPITLAGLGLIVSICDDRDGANSMIQLKAFLSRTASNLGEELQLGKRKVTLSKAIETGLFEIPNIGSLYAAGAAARNENPYSDGVFSYRFVKIENDKVIMNELEMENFRRNQHYYLTTDQQKERYRLIKSVVDSYIELKTKGLISEYFQLISNKFIVIEKGEILPNNKEIFDNCK